LNTLKIEQTEEKKRKKKKEKKKKKRKTNYSKNIYNA